MTNVKALEKKTLSKCTEEVILSISLHRWWANSVPSLPHSIIVPHSYSQHNNWVFVCKKSQTHIKVFLHPESLERKRAA